MNQQASSPEHSLGTGTGTAAFAMSLCSALESCFQVGLGILLLGALGLLHPLLGVLEGEMPPVSP